MTFETKDGQGALFKNDKKGVETRPDYTGNCMIDGTEFWVSAWLKKGGKGTFMSLAFKPKDRLHDVPAKPSVAKYIDDEPAPF